MSYRDQVEAAAAALKLGEDANWELARLTYENTLANGDVSTQRDAGRVPMRQWCADVAERSGRRFGPTPGYLYRKIWTEYASLDSDKRPSWHDAYWEVRGEKQSESFAGANAFQVVERAPLAVQADTVERLVAKPEVRQEVQRRETVRRQEYEQETAPIREEAQAREERAAEMASRDPVIQSLDASQALDDLGKAMRVFVQTVAAVFPRIKGMPDPKTDPQSQHLVLNQLLARSQGAVDQVRALLETGTPGGDIDAFVADVLAAAKSEGGGA